MMIPTARELGGSGAFATIWLLVEYGQATNKGDFLMTRQRHDDDDDGNVLRGRESNIRYPGDGRGPLLDGQRLRVSLMDGVDDLQAAVLRDKLARSVGLRDGALNRPGYRLQTDAAALDARAEAHRQYRDELENAWRNIPPVGAGERGQIGQREGDTCTINGRRGVLIDVGGGKLCCIADEDGGRDYLRESADAAAIQRDHAQTMAEVYAAHDAWLQDAWKGGKT
jgi:hypothetical protein